MIQSWPSLIYLHAEQFISRAAQCVDNINKRLQAGNTVSCFDMADMRYTNTSSLGKFFLRDFLF